MLDAMGNARPLSQIIREAYLSHSHKEESCQKYKQKEYLHESHPEVERSA